MNERLKLTISVVVYKPDLALLASSLASVQAALTYAAERRALDSHITVIDNSCDAAWPPRISQMLDETLPTGQATLVVSDRNGGYGYANNLAIREARSDFHLVANPDIFPENDAIDRALDYMSAHPEVALLSPDVRGQDGERHYLCKQDPTLLIMFLRGFAPAPVKRLFRSTLERFEMRGCDYNREIDGIGYPTGCFMFFRTSALQAIDGFDDSFFMYLEDADIGRRVSKLGAVRFVPSVRIVHRWARGTHNNWRLRWVTIQSAFIYWRKWGGVFRARAR
jgi:GT2 family glycosyltransferase